MLGEMGGVGCGLFGKDVGPPIPPLPGCAVSTMPRMLGEMGGVGCGLFGKDVGPPIPPLPGMNAMNQRKTILGRTGLPISAIGFGAYRVAQGVDDHRAALRHALTNGVTLVDTSANYTDGASERLIGEVERELEKRVVVVTKAGYLQGENFQLSQERKEAGRPFPDLVEFNEGLEHCIHPEFLEDQITRSLERLGRQKIEVFLLHNPEYYLMWAVENGAPLADARAEFERRIGLAFRYLETAVGRGRIEWYGVSANTFVHPAHDPAFVSLSRLWAMAEELGNHHFGAVQFPLNLLETGAATERNQPDGRTTLQFARDHNLGVLVNRPLNAIRDGRIVRLVDVPMPETVPSAADVGVEVAGVTTAETMFMRDLLPGLPLADEIKWQFPQQLAAGSLLRDGRWRDFGPLRRWLDVLHGYLAPQTQTAVHYLSHLENVPETVRAWLDSYVAQINRALTAVTTFFQAEAAQEMADLRAQTIAANPDWQADTLSQTAARAIRSLPGVSCVLVGMRQVAYVDDMLAELARPVQPVELTAFAQLREGMKT